MRLFVVVAMAFTALRGYFKLHRYYYSWQDFKNFFLFSRIVKTFFVVAEHKK